MSKTALYYPTNKTCQNVLNKLWTVQTYDWWRGGGIVMEYLVYSFSCKWLRCRLDERLYCNIKDENPFLSSLKQTGTTLKRKKSNNSYTLLVWSLYKVPSLNISLKFSHSCVIKHKKTVHTVQNLNKSWLLLP